MKTRAGRCMQVSCDMQPTLCNPRLFKSYLLRLGKPNVGFVVAWLAC